MADWIKVHRRLLDSDVFANPDTLKIWVWLLLKANYKDRTISLKTGKGYEDVLVKRGKVLFGRNKAEEFLHMSSSKIYRHIKKLEDLGKVSVKSNSHYSIITICKYELYQSAKDESEQPTIQPTNNQRTANDTTNEQPANTPKKDNKEDKVNKVFNNMPVVSDFNGLPNEYFEKGVEYVFRIKQIRIDKDTANSMWEIFKLQKLTGHDYYANEGKVYSHFLDWLKKQDFNNGNYNKKATGNTGREVEFDKP